MARREEAERRDFFEDLLSGRGAVTELLARGERLGLRWLAARGDAGGPRGQRGSMSLTGIHIDTVVAEAAAPSSSLVLSRRGRWS